MPRTVSHLIFDFLAPEQPDDCREASLALLAEALRSTGPVIHRGQVVSAGKDGGVDFDANRKGERIPATILVDDEGNEHEVPARDPNDADLAVQWKLPLAAEIPFPLTQATTTQPAGES